MAKKRVHVYYSGRVQGVGFRFTAEGIANQLELVGWVKNLEDGGVELVCEGEEPVVFELLDKIKNGVMKNYIRNTRVSWSEATDEFNSFEIRFW